MLNLLGIQFIGSSNVTVGDIVNISCISDLMVQRVEWVYNNGVVTSSSSMIAMLSFNPVQEYLNNREYICRAVTLYGTLERSITISVYSKFTKHNSYSSLHLASCMKY